MFSKKKEKVDITPGEPQFFVRYVGNVETYVASARGCTSSLVQKIWDKSEEEKHMTKYAMLIIPTGITLLEMDNKHELKFDIKNISHYSAEKGAHERVFCWIYQDDQTQRLFCHAVLCMAKEKAQQAAIMLFRTLQIAYKDWKCGKVKNARKNSKHPTKPDKESKIEYEFHFPPPPSGGELMRSIDANSASDRTSRSSSVSSGTTSSHTATDIADCGTNNDKIAPSIN